MVMDGEGIDDCIIGSHQLPTVKTETSTKSLFKAPCFKNKYKKNNLHNPVEYMLTHVIIENPKIKIPKL